MPTKKEQRQMIAGLISELTAEERVEKSKVVAEQLFATHEYKEAARVMCYVSLEDEVDTAPIIEKMLSDGKEVSVPVISGNDMTAVSITQDTKFMSRKFGVKEPLWGVTADFADLIIVPLRAFDGNCMRLGRGGGYYDRYLAERPYAHTIGLAFELQYIKKLATEEHDTELDAVITEKRAIGIIADRRDKPEAPTRHGFLKRLYDKLTDK
ncbi:MAG: 5-formyltetrahydrofolate cyclo-ligase [Clostridiaceae bacterium]|jgi:5-formyltetrahydrofolate cyclo-ligase|nr:5-formyltetrahydrofolate cyclo-ligase [Clostridiaceae bacterium]